MTARVLVRQSETIAEAAWALAQTLPKFGNAELSTVVKTTDKAMARIVRGWVAEGRLIVLQAPGVRMRGIWAVNPDYIPKPAPAGRSVEECIWTAMRQSKSFTPRILAVSATTPEIEVTLEFAQGYCRALLAAGYLTVSRKAVPGKTEPLYRLIRNTGPRPPREKRVRAVVDDNTETVTLIGGGQ